MPGRGAFGLKIAGWGVFRFGIVYLPERSPNVEFKKQNEK